MELNGSVRANSNTGSAPYCDSEPKGSATEDVDIVRGGSVSMELCRVLREETDSGRDGSEFTDPGNDIGVDTGEELMRACTVIRARLRSELVAVVISEDGLAARLRSSSRVVFSNFLSCSQSA